MPLRIVGPLSGHSQTIWGAEEPPLTPQTGHESDPGTATTFARSPTQKSGTSGAKEAAGVRSKDGQTRQGEICNDFASRIGRQSMITCNRVEKAIDHDPHRPHRPRRAHAAGGERPS